MRYVIALLLALTLSATDIAAQGAFGAACTYDECALRQESQLLIRGSRGVTVGSLGLFRAPRLVPLLNARSGVTPSSDSALAYARIFDRNYSSGMATVWVGAIAASIPIAVTFHRMENEVGVNTTDWLWLAAAMPGLAIEYWGTRKVRRAHAALGKAIWWHNRDLTR